MTFSSQKVLGILKRSLTPNRPYHAQWLLTSRCNYRCRGCNVWREKRCPQEATTDDVKKGLGVLRDLGVVEIVLSGGNPLLRDDIDEIIDYSSRYFVTTIYDNGSIAPRKIDALRKADFVSISLDTLDEKKFDHIRGVKGAWKNAMNAIETLNAEDIRVGVSPTISQLNLYEILDFTRYFTDKGVPVWYCLYAYDYPSENPMFGIGKKTDEFEITDREAAVKAFDGLMQMKKERSGVFITTQTLEALKQFFLTGQRTWNCKALKSFLIVDALGRVAGCHRQEPAASILELRDVWSSPRLDNLRNQYSQCAQCTYLCYIFYSIHGSVLSNLNLARDQWKNVALLRAQAQKSH
ncbi:MAG TPA: radical SAM protein [Candidatus Bathyarchaeia archaeon]|nr:radical SAM protein [Candidatus Bathyarchaeia archaeon]